MKNQQPAIVPHITPLRIRSTSREKLHTNHNNSFASSQQTGNKIFGDPNGLDYIGLRVNKDHASCNNHHLQLPPAQSTLHSTRPSHHRLDISPNMLQSRNKQQQQSSLFSPTYTQLQQTTHAVVGPTHSNQQMTAVDANALMNNINSEFQRFIDVDLRSALNEMKNQLFEQQFGFERDFENRPPQVIVQQPELNNSLLDPQKHNYAHQDDLKIVEEDLKSLTKQLEDSLNKHSQVVENTFDQQQNAIEQLSLAQAQFHEQQAEVNSQIQNQFKSLQSRLQSIEDKDQHQDQSIDKLLISVDEYRDDMQTLIKKLKTDFNNSLTDASDTLTKRIVDNEKANQYDHDLFKKRLDDLNQKLTHDINHQKLEDLEKIIKSQDNLQVMLDLRKRVQEMEDELSNVAIKNERDLKTQVDKVKFDFEEDQRRQDRIVQQLSQDCDFRFDNSNKYIEKVNQEKTQEIKDLLENLTQFKKHFKEDQLRQDNDLESLKNIMGDIQGNPKTDKAIELKLITLDDSLNTIIKKHKSDYSDLQQSQDTTDLKLKDQKLLIDSLQNEIEQLQQQQKHLVQDFDKKLEQESKLQSLDNQRLEKKLGLELDNTIQQIDENIQLLNQQQMQLQSTMQDELQHLKQLQEQYQEQQSVTNSEIQNAIEEIKRDIEELKQQSQPQSTDDNQIRNQSLENKYNNLLKDIEKINSLQAQTQQQVDLHKEEIQNLQIDNENTNKKFQENEQNLTETNKNINKIQMKANLDKEILKDDLQNQLVQLDIKLQGYQDNLKIQLQYEIKTQSEHQQEALSKLRDDLDKLESKNQQQQIDDLQNQIKALQEALTQTNKDQQIQDLQKDLQELEAKNLQLINDIQDQILKIDENTQNNMQNIADQVNAFVTDVDQQIKVLNDNDQTHLDNANQLQEQINQLTVKEQEQDLRLDALEQKCDQQDTNLQEVQQKLQNDFDIFKDNICKDFEFMEDQVVSALQNDTVNHIHKTQVAPLEVRVIDLERNRNMEMSQVIEQKIVKTPTKLTKEEEEEQIHKQLLSEMKRRRLWYLRKTPQDYIIEELMLKHRCTQEKAEKIYLRQLEKNKLIKSSQNPSPEGEGRRGTANARNTNESENTNNFLGIKHIYENIIHAASPSRAGSRAQEISHLEEGKERITTANVMRQPYSPYQGNLQVEQPDSDEYRKLSQSPQQKQPYIVIKSPMHEETIQTIEIVQVNKKPKQQQQQQQYYMNNNQNLNILTTTNAAAHPKNRQAQNTIDVDDLDYNDDDMIEESNIDIDELDGNVSQMRQNLDNIVESPNQDIRERRSYNRRENNRSAIFSKEYTPQISKFNETLDGRRAVGGTSQFLQQIERYSPSHQQKIHTTRNQNRMEMSTPQNAFKLQPQQYSNDYYSQENLRQQQQQYLSKSKPQGKAKIQMVEEEWGSGEKLSQNDVPADLVFLPQNKLPQNSKTLDLSPINNNTNTHTHTTSQLQNYQSQQNTNNYHNNNNTQVVKQQQHKNASSYDNTTKSQVNEFVVSQINNFNPYNIEDDQNNQDNANSSNSNSYNNNDYSQTNDIVNNTNNNRKQQYDIDYYNNPQQQLQDQQQFQYDQEQEHVDQQQNLYYDEEENGQDEEHDDDDYENHPFKQSIDEDQHVNNGDLSYVGSFNYDYQEQVRASHERDSIPYQYHKQQQ